MHIRVKPRSENVLWQFPGRYTIVAENATELIVDLPGDEIGAAQEAHLDRNNDVIQYWIE
jgi:hypothetical protein